ncbi:Nrm2 [Grosmannia clavigera kw1407]|uniref:Nrm2 n=1 Tax=Grosmannia clavigera (strain kw1407 / UAMH 11150) TaxID=655863 RepID=F0XPZ5_GROCL|nr:Nrm2 [Grosmannia clavigera kw1407]EFX00111.1 Nrm2 [Grosmannia clavigera kw1407]
MASPVKRRALAPLDANTTVSSPLPAKNGLVGSKPLLRGVEAAPGLSMQSVCEAPRTHTSAPAPEQPSSTAQKRSLPPDDPEDKDRPTTSTPKKVCLDVHVPAGDACSVGSVSEPASANRRHCSMSPCPSSVFDNSGIIEISQTTNVTEPNVQATRATEPHTPTREQSRRRAEILKLRLGLASYKLRTGQVSVPLDQLRIMQPTSQLARSQSFNSLNSNSRAQSRPRILLPMSPKPKQATRRSNEQPQSQLPRRQWTAWDRSRGLARGMGAVAAYSDSSSDDDGFFDDHHRGAKRMNLAAAPLLRNQTGSHNEFDRIDRIEDSDGQREREDKDNNRYNDTNTSNKSKVGVDEDVHRKINGSLPSLPQPIQPRGVLSGGASGGLLSISS